jgi:SAM-dependent methyltransferase
MIALLVSVSQCSNYIDGRRTLKVPVSDPFFYLFREIRRRISARTAVCYSIPMIPIHLDSRLWYTICMRHSDESSKSEKLISPAEQFDEIAFLYDELMRGVPYSEWIDYVVDILDQYDAAPSTVLDLCCGTGGASLVLAERGYQVTGVDISPEMVAHAIQKASRSGLFIDFHVQDAAELHLGRRFDLAVSLFDSLNYILESSAIQQVFYRVREHLEPGGLFIFDMNTELAFTAGLFDQTSRGIRSGLTYEWRGSYDRIAKICTIRMDFNYRRAKTERHVEITHYQRAYDIDEIVRMLGDAGLNVLNVYDAYAFTKVSKRSDRAFFVAAK